MPYAYGAIIEHEFDGTKLNLWLTFRHPMNQDNEPALGKWELECDSVAKAISDSDWIDEFTLWLESTATVAYPDRVTLAYTGTDENLETTWGKNWEPWGDTLSEDRGKGISYEDRGDPAAADFDQTTLTQDGNWHDLDLSGIIPVNAHAVHIAILVQDNLVGSWFQMRTNGNANVINATDIRTQIAAVFMSGDFIVHPDADRKIEYRAAAVVFTKIYIRVRGWWY